MMDFIRRQPIVVALGAIVALLLIVIAVEAMNATANNNAWIFFCRR